MAAVESSGKVGSRFEKCIHYKTASDINKQMHIVTKEEYKMPHWVVRKWLHYSAYSIFMDSTHICKYSHFSTNLKNFFLITNDYHL